MVDLTQVVTLSLKTLERIYCAMPVRALASLGLELSLGCWDSVGDEYAAGYVFWVEKQKH